MKARLLLLIIGASLFAATANADLSASTKATKIAERLGVPTIEEALLCKAEHIKFEVPRYPQHALRKQQEGWVILNFDLDGTGRASNIVVDRSMPEDVFVQASIDALKKTRFKDDARKSGCKTFFTFSLGE